MSKRNLGEKIKLSSYDDMFGMEEAETTDINDIIINDQKLGEQVIYNLNGQRLNNSERGGLYIINGKKVVR